MATDFRFWAAALLAVLLFASDADARVEGLRLGVSNSVFDEFDREKGININGEVVFSAPDFLRPLGAPRPYAMVSVNTSGNTNVAGVGLAWRIPIRGRWELEPSFAYVVHDGETHNPYQRGDPRREAFERQNVIYGSRDLFRESVAIERQIRPDLGAQVYFAHMSHGQIIGSGYNQGAEEIGVRLAWRLNARRR